MMRNYKILTIVTGMISVCSLVLILISNPNHVLYDISLSLFGSGFLGFIMSNISYLVERKRAMELFYQEAILAVDKLMTIQYLDYRVPSDLLGIVFSDEEKIKGGYLVCQDPTKQLLFQWCIKNGEITNQNETDNLKQYQKILTDEKTKIDRFIDECISFSKISLRGIDDAYGNLDFMFGNKRIREDLAYSAIYNELKMITHKIRNESFHFKLYLEGKGNYYICFTKVNEINDMLYKKILCEDSEYSDEYEVYTIFANKKDSLESSIEKFRCEIYHDKNISDYKSEPVIFSMRARNNTVSSSDNN